MELRKGMTSLLNVSQINTLALYNNNIRNDGIT